MKNFAVYATIKVKEWQDYYDEETVKFMESKKHKVISIDWYKDGNVMEIVIQKNKNIIVVFTDYCDIEFEIQEVGEKNENGED